MKNLSITAITAAFLSIGTVSIAPAQATNWTQLDYNGKFEGQIQFPFLINLSKDAIASLTVDNLSDRLSDAGDAELTIEQPFSSLSPELNNLLDTYQITIDNWTGNGFISNQQNILSNFYFEYNKLSDVLTIKDYDFTNIQVCLSSTCNLAGEGTFSGFSSLFPISSVSGTLNFDIDQTATPLSDTQPSFGSGTQSVPEPSLLLGFIGLGGLFATKCNHQKSV